jgi:4-amino-4-deoxy-L-arabinose transferase-like glycosyltransferase
MTTWLKASLLFLFIFQVAIAANFELAHDEAYYWLFSRHLDWAYFDHPPFVAVMIRLFSFLGHSEIGVRFGFILLQFLTLFLLFRLVPKKKQALVTILFFAFPLASIGGMLALPDMPLLFMTAIYITLLKKYLEKDTLSISVALGTSIAILFYAKYHGVLLIFFTLCAIPKLLARKSFYLVAFVALVLFLPHLWWQYEHQFSTLRYHFIERPSSSFSFNRTLEYMGLQIILAGLFAGPVVWWSVVKGPSKDLFERALKCICIGTVVFFFVSSLSKKVEANWTIFLSFPLIYLSVQSEIWERKSIKNLGMVCFVICLLARIVFVIPTFKMKRLTEFRGWKSWAQMVQSECENRPIMANAYQVAAKLSFYLDRDVPALNYHSRKNQFDYWQFENEFTSDEVCYLTDKSEFSGSNVETPEGKTQILVTNRTLTELLKLKAEVR